MIRPDRVLLQQVFRPLDEERSQDNRVMSLLPSIRPSSDWTPIRALAVPLRGELPGVHCGRPVAQFCSDQVQISNEPDFGASVVIYRRDELLTHAEEPL
jgi:hypothetical protein